MFADDVRIDDPLLSVKRFQASYCRQNLIQLIATRMTRIKAFRHFQVFSVTILVHINILLLWFSDEFLNASNIC